MAAIGYVVGLSVSRSKQKIQYLSNHNTNQYINRLKEFFIDDYPKAIDNYSKYVNSGMSPQSAFDTLVESLELSTLTIGEFND